MFHISIFYIFKEFLRNCLYYFLLFLTFLSCAVNFTFSSHQTTAAILLCVFFCLCILLMCQTKNFIHRSKCQKVGRNRKRNLTFVLTFTQIYTFVTYMHRSRGCAIHVCHIVTTYANLIYIRLALLRQRP